MEDNFTNSPKQNEDVISNYLDDLAQSNVAHHESVIKKARNALYLAGTLMFIGEIVAMFRDNEGFEVITFTIAIIELGIFLGLGLWTKQKPYSAIIGGLVAFIGIHIFAMLVSGYANGISGALLSLVSGIIIKIFVLVTLFNALRNAKELQNIQRRGI